ncbi:MAG: hypothetical protein ACKESB_02630 [Candidatus Hodgkinia cicadicola]
MYLQGRPVSSSFSRLNLTVFPLIKEAQIWGKRKGVSERERGGREREGRGGGRREGGGRRPTPAAVTNSSTAPEGLCGNSVIAEHFNVFIFSDQLLLPLDL